MKLLLTRLLPIAILLAVRSAHPETTVIALTGEPLPDGNGQFGDFYGTPVINANGDVAFYTSPINTGVALNYAVYLYRSQAIIKVARSYDALPLRNGYVGDPGVLVLNDLGQIALRGTVFDDTTLPKFSLAILYWHEGASLVNVAQSNLASPDGPNFDYLYPPQLSSTGNVLFNHYTFDGNLVTPFARIGDAVPGGGQITSLVSSGPIEYGINSSGQVAFFAESRNPDRVGVYVRDGASMSKIVALGDPVPEGNGKFRYPACPAINNAGQVAFQTTLSDTSGGAADSAGIYLKTGPSIVKVARANDVIPGGGGRFRTFTPPAINATGKVLFHASLSSTVGGTTDDSCIYLGDGGSLVKIMREGDAPPEGDGQFDDVNTGPAAVNSAGQVLFLSGLRNTAAGGFASGIYLADGTQQLKILRTGDQLDGKIVSYVGLGGASLNSGGQDGRFDALNDYGQVAYSAVFTDGASGVFRYTPDLHWRSGSGNWDTSSSWTLRIRPGAPHIVNIDPSSDLSVVGPTVPTLIKELTVGGGTGLATLALSPSGSVTATGRVTIQPNGTLAGTGTIVANLMNSGTISPGSSSPGAIQVNGDYAQTTTGKLSIELGGTNIAADLDRLLVSGNASLGGTLHVALINGFVPAAGSSFDVLDCGSLTGKFDIFDLPELAGSLAWDTSQLYTNGVVSVAPVPEPTALLLASVAVIPGSGILVFRSVRRKPFAG